MRAGDRIGSQLGTSDGGDSSDPSEDDLPDVGREYPELVESISPPRSGIDERERIEGYLKRPFQTPTGPNGEYMSTDFGTLLGVFASFAEELTDVRNNVLGSRYVDIACGQSLDNIGKLIQLPRETGEEDPRYRIRLKAYFRRLIGGGSIDEIRQTVALLLGCDVAKVELTEPFHITCARFDIHLDQSVLEDAPITAEELVAFVQGFRAAGVDVTFSLSGSFTNRSLLDLRNGIDLGERGYDEATYSGELI